MSDALVRGKPIDDLIANVGRARPRLVDAWEATAVIESLGYTDARVWREFGFADTISLGAHVFEKLARRAAPAGTDNQEDTPRGGADLLDSLTASFIYAIPWLCTFVTERVRPDVLRLPGHAGPPLSLALMFSLIVSGGFIQAIARRGHFYIGMKQPGLAALICGYLFRLGCTVSVMVGVLGIAIGWYFSLFSWPYLVLAADEFIVLTVLWMSCGIIAVRQERWRVPIAFAVGAAAFVACRLARLDALVAQLVAAGVVLAAALAQVPMVFALPKNEEPGMVRLPRLPVLLYHVQPYFWYGTLYFCFLFADRFAASASVAALTGAPFGMRPDYKLGMDIALLTFLFGAAAIEYGNIRFTRLLRRTTLEESGDTAALRARFGRIHARALAIVIAGFIPCAVLIALGVKRLLPDATRAVWATVAAGDLGYLLLAVGLLNALVLFSLSRPWTAVKALALALAVNITVGYVTSHVFNTYFAAVGLIASATLLAIYSTAAVRAAFRRADYAVAAA